MAQYRNAAQFYQKNSVQTASPAKIILMLYDGAIKFCHMAQVAIDEKNIEMANLNIQKAQKIIVQLRVSLDTKYPVSQEFDRVYDYIYRRLVEANMKKDNEILEEALKHIKTMRETWIEVMKKTHRM